MASFDHVAASELVQWCENHGQGWERQGQHIVAMLAKKAAKGTYSIPLAVKAWQYYADEGAKSYTAWAKGGSDRTWWVSKGSVAGFDAPTRREAARQLEENYREQVEYEANDLIAARAAKGRK